MMKKHLFLLGFLIFSTLSNAQSVDLNTLAQGKLIDHFIIHDEEGKVFGYMHIFKVDEIDKETVEYQYVLLDKNLNISLRTNFVDKKHKRSFRVFYSCNYMGDHFILQCSHYLNPSYGKRLLTNNNPTPELIANTIQVIGYDQKEAPKEYYISGEQLMEVPEDYDDLKKGFRGLSLAKNDIFSLGTNKFSGYGAFTKTHKLLVFNAENKLLWDYQFAFDKDKLKSSFTLRTRNEKFILASKRDVRNNKTRPLQGRRVEK